MSYVPLWKVHRKANSTHRNLWERNCVMCEGRWPLLHMYLEEKGTWHKNESSPYCISTLGELSPQRELKSDNSHSTYACKFLEETSSLKRRRSFKRGVVGKYKRRERESTTGQRTKQGSDSATSSSPTPTPAPLSAPASKPRSAASRKARKHLHFF